MSRAFVTALVLSVAGASSVQAQTINTYTQSQAGPNNLVYGLPVPLPIESLTPVDGFRSYASLDARLQGLALASDDLSVHDVGDTHAGRTIWAYVASDADAVDVEGRPEAAFFINAATHAREWAAPEVSTGTIERLVAGASDGGLVRYLLDNTRAVIIPVQNIDGFLQTQRYPTQAIIGGDPDVATWPRDGRMRRKNMPNVDEVLTTFGDRLGGIDLNRNHQPFWATSTGSSSNPNSIVYHGVAPHSEPENLAIERAAELGPASRMRLGIDVHSFSRVFYTANTARAQLNNIQAALVQKLRLHHLSLSGKNYADVPDPPNLGIGTASEYFAYNWLVPAWTLELEPQNSPVEYGGLNVNHGGFILPASEARRVRESWAETHAIAFYIMSGPPHLSRVRLYRTDSGLMTYESRWDYDAASGNRVRATPLAGAMQASRRYRAELAFNKPMRYRNAGGQVAALPGSSAVPALPAVALVRDGERIVLDTSQGAWLTEPGRIKRYRDDTFAFEFDAPTNVSEYRLEVAASDLAGAQLDADPASPVDWAGGSWSQFESANGTDGITGGPDATTSIRTTSEPESQIQTPASVLIGEGDLVRIVLTRLSPDARAISLRVPLDDVWNTTTLVVNWGAGEGGERAILVGLKDDVASQGDRDATLRLAQSIDGASAPDVQVQLRVLDNDRPQESVVRATARVDLGNQLRESVELSNSSTAPSRALVLDGNLTYFGPTAPHAQCIPLDFNGPQMIFGNGAFLGTGLSTCGRSFAYSGDQGEVDFRDLTLSIRDPSDFSTASTDAPQKVVNSDSGLLVGTGDLILRRVVIDSGEAVALGGGQQQWALSHDTGTVRLERSRIEGFSGPDLDGALKLKNTTASIHASSIGETAARHMWKLESSALSFFDSSFVAADTTSGFALGDAGTTLVSARSLLQSRATLCNGAMAMSSGSANLVSDPTCLPLVSSDIVSRVVPVPPFDPALGGFNPPGSAIDAGGANCGSVDQRGAPRPQTLTPGATPRCDIGAIELGVNPYRGAWSAERNGHGVDIQTTGNQLFLIWYTYQDDGQPTAYSAIAPLTGKHWETDLRLTSRNPQTGAISTVNVGRVTLDFDSDVDARLGWRFDARGATGSERIRPSQATLGEPRFEATGLWSAPGDGGYGVNVVRVGQVTGATAYYYDAQGIQRWALGISNDADATEFAMTSFTGFCPDCDAATHPVVGRPAGKVLIHFHTPQRARMDLQLIYPGANGGTWNRTGTMFVPLNDPVDNRAARSLLNR